MSEYLKDAQHFFKRTAQHLSKADIQPDDVHDAVVQFAFGIERILKAIIHNVNPVFVYEDQSFSNMIAVLHHDELTPAAKGVIFSDSKKGIVPNTHVLLFEKSLQAAAKFSNEVMRRQTTLRKVNDVRNVIAHRTLAQVDTADILRLCRGQFAAVVDALAQEMRFDPATCYSGNPEALRAASRRITAEDEEKDGVTPLLTRHKAVWDERKLNVVAVAKMETATTAVLEVHGGGGDGGAVETACPACGRRSILFYDLDGEWEDGHAVTFGPYASGLRCEFCDLSLNAEDHYAAIDELKLNDDLIDRLRD